MLEHTKLRHSRAQIVSWAPIHARDFFIVLAPGAVTEKDLDPISVFYITEQKEDDNFMIEAAQPS